MLNNGEKFSENNHSPGQTRKNSKKESALVRACIDYLSLNGYIVLRNNSGFIFLEDKNGKRAIKMGKAGASDIIACSPEGKFVAIECKVNSKLTEKQKQFLDDVAEKGGIALVVKSLDDLITFIKQTKN